MHKKKPVLAQYYPIMLGSDFEGVTAMKFSILCCFFSQSSSSHLLQELSAVTLHVSQWSEALLRQGDRDLLSLWHRGPLRHILTKSLPRFLSLLQDASLLGQQELRRECRDRMLAYCSSLMRTSSVAAPPLPSTATMQCKINVISCKLINTFPLVFE